MPNVIAAFQLNEKDKDIEFDEKVKDLGIPEHKEHYKDKNMNQNQNLINTHKSFNDLL